MSKQSLAVFGLLATIVSIYLVWLLPIYWGILLLIPWVICGAINDDSTNGVDDGGGIAIAFSIVALVELYCWWPTIWGFDVEDWPVMYNFWWVMGIIALLMGLGGPRR